MPAASWILDATKYQAGVLNFAYWLGLLLLMFLSGAETQQLFTREERWEVGRFTIAGTGIPFVLARVWALADSPHAGSLASKASGVMLCLRIHGVSGKAHLHAL